MDKKALLKELIKDKGIVIPEKPVKLSGGGESLYYYDIKKVVLDPKGLNLASDLALEIISGLQAKSVGGLEVGSIPFAAAISLKSSMTSNPLSAFIVRKKTKEHGLQKEIEGNLESPVVIVDDVITQGKSILETVDKIVKERCEVVGVIAIVDREEGINEEQLRDRNIELFRIFRHSDFKDFIDQQLKTSSAKTEAYQSV